MDGHGTEVRNPPGGGTAAGSSAPLPVKQVGGDPHASDVAAEARVRGPGQLATARANGTTP